MKTGRTYFVADLHLTDERPAATGRFFRFLEEQVAGADALYILGDLFEAWTGDDHGEAVATATARRLKALATSGTPVYFQHGNRDFMLAQRYASHAGMTLIADPARVDLYGVPTLLMHGDTLCSDDTDYIAFRAQVRDPAWREAFLGQPLTQRKALIAQMRAQSRQAQSRKAAEIMDTNAESVINTLRSHGYPRLIHGHTHRPARHIHEVDGRTCERWVLPDWYQQGGYLRCDANGCKAVKI